MSGPFVEATHVDAGVCHCPTVTDRAPMPPKRVPSLTCGLSKHRIEAAAAAELRRSTR